MCHECVVEIDTEHKVTFQGPSPDEIAICKGASDIGSTFKGRNSENIAEVDIFGKTRKFKVKKVGNPDIELLF